MPKKSNSPPPMRQNGDYACVYLNGKRVRLGRWDSDDARKNYRRFLVQWAANSVAVTTPSEGRATVDELALAFLTYKKERCGESDFGNYRTALETLIQSYSGTAVADFGSSKLDAVRNRFVERGYSRGHCNKLTGLIKTAFRWGVAREIVPSNVYQSLRCLEPLLLGQTTAPEGDPVEPVPDEVVLRTIPYLPPIISEMVKIQRLAAMRPNEVCRMKVGEIDRTGDVWLYRPPKHKNSWRGHKKIVPLGKEEQAIITPRLTGKGMEAPVFSPREAVAEHANRRAAKRKTKIQPSQKKRMERNAKNPKRKDGTHYRPKSYTQAIQRSIETANSSLPVEERIPHWSPYQLRHTGITEIALESDLQTAKAIAGQRSLKITEGVYFHGDTRLAIQSVERRGNRLLFGQRNDNVAAKPAESQGMMDLESLFGTSVVAVGISSPVFEP